MEKQSLRGPCLEEAQQHRPEVNHIVHENNEVENDEDAGPIVVAPTPSQCTAGAQRVRQAGNGSGDTTRKENAEEEAGPEELSAWLQEHGLARIEAKLRDEDVVSVLDLNDLNANDWKELGLTEYAVRDVMAALPKRWSSILHR
jgi:hypothetical protein